MRDILFVHPNFPGQFVHLLREMLRQGGWRVWALGGETAKSVQGVELERWGTPRPSAALADPLVGRMALDARRGEAAAAAARRLAAAGADPQVIVGHPGWGDMLFLHDVFPRARMVSYLEFWFSFAGGDVNFDPEFAVAGPEAEARLRLRNAPMLFAASESDLLLSPTVWQADRFPPAIRERIHVIHDGIDTQRAAPHGEVRVDLPDGRTLTSGDEVLTFVARSLEPYRGFHVFMRALPAIMAARPNVQVVVVGADDTSYGAPPAGGGTWYGELMREVGDGIDVARLHMLGRIPYDAFLGVLQISRVHVYLTYPFVLSWSLLEAMSCGALVVASDTPPVTEFIEDGVNGLLVPMLDPHILAATVSRTLERAPTLSRLRERARQTVRERADLQVCVARQLDLIRGLY